MYTPPLFQHLLNFGYQRRGLEILGFYIAYLISSIIISGAVGSLVAAIFGVEARDNSRADVVAASIVVLVVTFLIIKKKRLSGLLYTFLPLGSAILCQFLSPVLALLVPAYLSSLAPQFNFTPLPRSGDIGANEQKEKEIRKENLPPPTGLGDARK